LVVSLFGGGQIILNYGTQIGKLPDIPEEIFGPESVCGNNTTRVYSVNPVDRAVEYRWKVSYPYFIVHPTSGDTVRTYQGTQRSVTVQFPGSGSKTRGWISAAAATGGPCAVVGGIQSLYIDFGPQTHQIEGPPSIAQNSVVAFEVNGPNLSNFIWSVPSGINILSGANTDRVVVEAPTVTSGTITATYRSCGVLRSASKQVSVTGTIGGGPGIGGFARNALTEEELGLSQVSLYPNPATDQVSISSESPLKQVTVVNLMGQVIKTLDQISGNTTMLDVKDLKSGVYYVVAVDQLGSKHSHSLIVE
ncbi:MAG: T9SS type A sorting domain-containing protein, partial [Bacteroidota bacterium]